MMEGSIKIIALTVSFLPAGFAISILTERLASRDVLSKAAPRVWTTIVKCGTCYLVWKYLIFLTWADGTGFGAECHLPTLSPWISTRLALDDGQQLCELADAVKITFVLFLRCLLFYFGAVVGATLQPVGLTGGIACGKSTVTQIFRKSTSSKNLDKDAFVVIDLDSIAHDILVPGKMGSDCGYKRLTDAFAGEDIFVSGCSENDKEKPIDRRKLGDIVFRNSNKRKILNRITHPLISKIMMKQIVRHGLFPSEGNASIVCVDIPLLYEIGLKMRLLFGIKVVVACDTDTQLKRLMERNKDLTKEQCLHRINSQIPIAEKVKMADIVIWNNGSFDELRLQVENARKEIIHRSQAFLGITLSRFIFVFGAMTWSSCMIGIANIYFAGFLRFVLMCIPMFCVGSLAYVLNML
jgi:dephospho-CoA kinase